MDSIAPSNPRLRLEPPIRAPLGIATFRSTFGAPHPRSVAAIRPSRSPMRPLLKSTTLPSSFSRPIFRHLLFALLARAVSSHHTSIMSPTYLTVWVSLKAPCSGARQYCITLSRARVEPVSSAALFKLLVEYLVAFSAALRELLVWTSGA